jgi:hypothetical protein
VFGLFYALVNADWDAYRAYEAVIAAANAEAIIAPPQLPVATATPVAPPVAPPQTYPGEYIPEGVAEVYRFIQRYQEPQQGPEGPRGPNWWGRALAAALGIGIGYGIWRLIRDLSCPQPEPAPERPPTPQPTATSEPSCRIEVRSYPTTRIPLIDHVFIHFTDATGQEYEFRGGPEYHPEDVHPPSRCFNCVGTPFGAVTATTARFLPERGAIDYGVPGTRGIPVLSGSEACGKYFCLENEVRRINRMCKRYRVFPGPNSNTVASTMLSKCEIPLRKPFSFAFGWNSRDLL